MVKNIFGEVHIPSMNHIVNSESGFNPKAVNSISGACGLFQSNPCSKLPCKLDDIDCQIKWGANYVKQRYGTPSAAWEFWKDKKWY